MRFGPALLLLALVLVGCAPGGGGGDAGRSTTLTVFAAASLTTSFEEIGEQFEAQHDGVDVQLNSGGSSDLVAQIREGAPADVFASADQANMEKLTVEGLEGQEPRSFAGNTLQIAVAPGNPLDIASLADVTRRDVNLVACAPEVPCGSAALQAAEAAGIELTPVSEEQSVTDVLAKVTSGEADAGLVYVTDVLNAADEVHGVDFPEATAVVTTCAITTLADSDARALAEDFVDFVLSRDGQAILRDAGFAPAR